MSKFVVDALKEIKKSVNDVERIADSFEGVEDSLRKATFLLNNFEIQNRESEKTISKISSIYDDLKKFHKEIWEQKINALEIENQEILLAEQKLELQKAFLKKEAEIRVSALEAQHQQIILFNENLELVEKERKARREILSSYATARRELSAIGRIQSKVVETWKDFEAFDPLTAKIVKWTTGIFSIGGALGFLKSAIIDNARILGELQVTTAQFFTGTGKDPSSIANEWAVAAREIEQANGLFETENILESFKLFAQEGILETTDKLKGYVNHIQKAAIFQGEAANTLIPFLAELEKTKKVLPDIDKALGAVNYGFAGMQAEATEVLTKFARLGPAFDRVSVEASALNRSLIDIGFSSKTAGEFTLSLLQTSINKMPKAFQHLFQEIRKGEGGFQAVAQELETIRELARSALEVGDLSSLAEQTGLSEDFLLNLANTNESLEVFYQNQRKIAEQLKQSKQAEEAQEAIFTKISTTFKKISAAIGEEFLPVIDEFQKSFKPEPFVDGAVKIAKAITNLVGVIAKSFIWVSGVVSEHPLLSSIFGVGIGTAFIGFRFIRFLRVLKGEFGGVGQTVVESFGKSEGVITKFSQSVGKTLGSLGKGVGQALEGIGKGIAGVFASFGNPAAIAGILAVTAAIAGLTAVIGHFGPKLKEFLKGVSTLTESIGESLATIIEAVAGGISGIIGQLAKSLGEIMLVAVDALKKFEGTEIGGSIANVISASANTVSGFLGVFQSFFAAAGKFFEGEEISPPASSAIFAAQKPAGPTPAEMAQMSQVDLLRVIATLQRQQVEILSNQNILLQRNLDVATLRGKSLPVGGKQK